MHVQIQTILHFCSQPFRQPFRDDRLDKPKVHRLMADHDMDPDSEPDYGDAATHDATNDDGCLTYGDLRLRKAVNQGEAQRPSHQYTQCWAPDGTSYWNQWHSVPNDALEAGWGQQGPSSSGAPPPPPVHVDMDDTATLKRWEEHAAALKTEHRGWTNIGLMSTKLGIPFLQVVPHSPFESPTMVCFQ